MVILYLDVINDYIRKKEFPLPLLTPFVKEVNKEHLPSGSQFIPTPLRVL